MDESVSFPLQAHAARLEKLHNLYAISVGPFAQPEAARRYIARVKAGLLWLSLTHRVGISYPKEISDVTLSNEPIQISERSNFAGVTKAVGWDIADGHYNADEIVVRPEHKKLMRLEMGRSIIRTRISVERFVNCFSGAVVFPCIDRINEVPRLQLAIELYGAFSFELTENAQLVTLVTSLESLVAPAKIPDHLQKCVEKVKALVRESRDSYAKESKEWRETDLLLSRVRALDEESVGNSLRTYVSRVVEQATELGQPKEVADRLRKIYKVRSRLLHDGVAEQGEIKHALGFLRDFVPNLLTVLFTEEAHKDIAREGSDTSGIKGS